MQQNTPQFSIVVPTFNRAGVITKTLRSIKEQTLDKWETLVVDDGSSDNTREIIEKWRSDDKRFSYLLNSTGNQGACASRNLGLQRARGEYIIFLDSDDQLLPDALNQRLALLEANSSIDFIVTPGAVAITESLQPDLLWNIETNIEPLVRFLNFDSPWQTAGATWRLKTLKANNILWDNKLSVWQDVDFHLQALMKKMSYEIFWRCPYDYIVNNTTSDSISRVGFHAPEKSEGKKYFWKKYLRNAELGKCDKRYLESVLLSVTRHFAQNKLWKEADNILSEAGMHQVLPDKVISNLKLNLKASRFSFGRISFPDKKFYSNPHPVTLQTVAVPRQHTQS